MSPTFMGVVPIGSTFMYRRLKSLNTLLSEHHAMQMKTFLFNKPVCSHHKIYILQGFQVIYLYLQKKENSVHIPTKLFCLSKLEIDKL